MQFYHTRTVGIARGGSMQKDLKHKCNSASHKQLKSNAKNRLDELQDMFSSLQYARKEGQNNTVCELEDQVNQMLKNWKTELNETSSTSSLHGPGSSLGLDSADIRRLLLLSDEEDDATSPLDESKAGQHNCGGQPLQDGHGSFLSQNVVPLPCFPRATSSPFIFAMLSKFKPNYVHTGVCLSRRHSFFVSLAVRLVYLLLQNPSTNYILQERGFEGSNYVWPNMHDPNLKTDSQAQYHQFELQPSAGGEFIISSDNLDQNLLPSENVLHDFTGFLPATVQPPPSAFLGSKCALWDCPRPPQTFDQDYCNDIHARLALNEGAAGTIPVLRPGGISLKDSILFDALKAKIQGKEVGIPQCDGAVSARSPWNAPELFDLSLLEGETLREWLFFDKPRKAFESGNRKQRSLPDYIGRGWHESRKQVVKEFGGLKRSYYMDPQPVSHLEWHLYEYGIDKCDAQALYRLELKLVDGKKKSKGKVSKDPVADLQTQMGKLTADLPTESKFPKMGMSETGKASDGCSPSTPFAPDQLTSTAGSVDNGKIGVSDNYVNILTDCKRI